MASTQQTRVIIGIESGAKLHELLREPQMPSMKMVDEWRENPVFEQQYAAAAATGAATREAAKQKMEKQRNKTAARTDFTFVGVPTTVAGTPDDERRQQLSRRLTAIIADNYTTPPGRPAAAPEPKPLILTPAVMPKPARLTPEGEAALKQAVLARLRIGDTSPVIERQTPGFYTNKAIAWRKDPAFAADWNAAVAAGRNRLGLGPKLPGAIRSTRPAPVGPFDQREVDGTVYTSDEIIPPTTQGLTRILGPSGGQPTLAMELAYQFGTEQADAPDELSQVVEQLALVNRELSQRSRLRTELIARIKALALEL